MKSVEKLADAGKRIMDAICRPNTCAGSAERGYRS
jgi:hypothetical protein